MFKKSLNMFKVYSRRLVYSKQSAALDWTKEQKKIMEPFEYIKKIPNKHVDLIPSAFNHWLQISEEKLKCIQEINQAYATWIILLDDIADDSPFRYGAPAAHCVFGVGLTIYAADMALLQIRKQIVELGDPLGPEIFLKRLHEFILGQGLDLYWRDKNIYPPEETHTEMTKSKSGSYFMFLVELMQLFSSNKTDYRKVLINMAVYYETLDDYYNLFHPKALARLATIKQENHITCSDISDGKITLAIIHASQFPDVATELAVILKQRTSDPKLQNRVITLLKRHGSDEYVRDKLRKLEADIHTEIARLGGNPPLTALMDDLSFQTHEREPEHSLYS